MISPLKVASVYLGEIDKEKGFGNFLREKLKKFFSPVEIERMKEELLPLLHGGLTTKEAFEPAKAVQDLLNLVKDKTFKPKDPKMQEMSEDPEGRKILEEVKRRLEQLEIDIHTYTTPEGKKIHIWSSGE